MTIGIYKLIFQGLEDWPYIGQSQNIHDRFIAHKSALKLGNSSPKLLDAFEISNKIYPALSVIEECSIEELDSREFYWINHYDSINNGLNSTDKIINKAYGEGNFNSKYTNSHIENTFIYICNNLHLSNNELASNCNVSISVIQGILAGKIHTWLKNKYPEDYTELINRQIKRTSSAKKLGIDYPKIKSPDGTVYTVENLSEFSKIFNLNKSSLHQLLTGKRKSCSKWVLA